MALKPNIIVVTHLVDVMGDMPLLQLHPLLKMDFARFRMEDLVHPYWLRQGNQELVGHPAEAADHLESFTRTLMKIAESAGPTARVKFHGRYSGLRDEISAKHIRAGFTVCKVKDNFVNAPAFARRLEEPHLFREHS